MKTRVGRIPYLNSVVFYGGLNGQPDLELVSLVPSALSRAAREGTIDAGPLPMVTCFELEEQFAPLGDFCIATVERARSIYLYSMVPAEELSGAMVAVTGETSTTVQLLKVLLTHRYNAASINYVPLNYIPQLVSRAGDGHGKPQGFLLIGDQALAHRRGIDGYPFQFDLGQVWHEWTGLPFVFARWVARRGLNSEILKSLAQGLEASISLGLEEAAHAAMPRNDLRMTEAEVREYVLSFHYRMGDAEHRAVEEFRRLLALESLSTVAQKKGS